MGVTYRWQTCSDLTSGISDQGNLPTDLVGALYTAWTTGRNGVRYARALDWGRMVAAFNFEGTGNIRVHWQEICETGQVPNKNGGPNSVP
jgi:hypothetical protein